MVGLDSVEMLPPQSPCFGIPSFLWICPDLLAFFQVTPFDFLSSVIASLCSSFRESLLWRGSACGCHLWNRNITCINHESIKEMAKACEGESKCEEGSEGANLKRMQRFSVSCHGFWRHTWLTTVFSACRHAWVWPAHSFYLSLSHFLEILRFKEDNGCETISMLPNWLPRRC